MVSSDVESKKAAINKEAEKSDPKEIEALGVAIGIDDHLPFTTPFSPTWMGTKKNSDEELHEVLNYGVDNGPTVRQLTAMRRLDGQARALFSLLTLPIRGALKDATFVPAEGGEEEAEFIDKVFNLPPSPCTGA